MAALSAARLTASRGDLQYFDVPVAGSTTIYAGGMVMAKSDGYCAPAAASASNKGVVGVAQETVVNAGADGAKMVRVARGVFKFAGDSLAVTIINTLLYADDDQTVDETQATNCPKAGLGIEFLSATEAWVDIGAGTSG